MKKNYAAGLETVLYKMVMVGIIFNFLIIEKSYAKCDIGGTVTEIASIPFVATGLSTCGAGDNLTAQNIVACGSNNYIQGEELVLVFTAPTTELYHISLTNSNGSFSSLKLYNGCPLQGEGAGQCVVNSSGAGENRILEANLVAGQTYYLVVGRWGSACFNFDLTIDTPEKCPAPGTPGWQAISLPYDQQGLTTCGLPDHITYWNYNTIGSGSSNYVRSPDMVFTFEAPETKLYHITVYNSSQSFTGIKLFDGCPLLSQGGKAIAYEEGGNSDRILEVTLLQGQIYYLVVSRWGDACFNFDLKIDAPQQCPQPGTPGWEAISLPFNGQNLTTCGVGNNITYWNSINCGSTNYFLGPDMVYIFDAPVSATFNFALTNVNNNFSGLKLYEGCPLLAQGGVCIENSSGGEGNRTMQADLVGGKTYYLVVSRWGDACYNFDLSITSQCNTPLPIVQLPAPVCPGDALSVLTVENPGSTVSWYADEALTILLATGTTFTPVTDTTTTYFVTNTLLCESEPTAVTVQIISPPQIETTGLTQPANMVCEGSAFSLSVNEGTNPVWSTGATTAQIDLIASQSGTYSVTLSLNGCVLTSEIDIKVLENTPPLPVTMMRPADNSLNVSLTPTLSWIPGNNSTGFDVYLWKAADGNRPETPIRENIPSAQTTLKKDEVEHATAYSWQIVSRNGECGITDSPVQTFTTQDLPNLVVSDFVIQTDGFSGQPISVTFQVFNAGNTGTGNDSWRDALFLSLDNNLDLDVDVLLGTWTNQRFLLPGESYTQTVEVIIPQQYLGDYYFIVAANYNCAIRTRGIDGINFFNECGHLLTETTLADNWRVTESSITFSWPPLPDLNPSSFGTPDLAFAGDTINISYVVGNIGQSFARSNINRLVRNMCADITGGFTGDPAKTDKRGVMIVRDNLINCLLVEPYWHDMIFLSTSPVHDPENDILLTTEVTSFRKENFIANGNTIPKPYEPISFNDRTAILDEWDNTPDYLSAGASYQKDLRVGLPGCIDGEYYLHLIADYSGWVWEYNSSNNIITRPLQIITTPPPDLVVSGAELSEKPSSGQMVTLDYQISNIGAGKPYKGYWLDLIYLLPSPEFDEQTAIPVKQQPVLGGETLEPGQTLDVSTSFRIPNGLNGQYYVFIHTNAAEPVCEFDPENNYFTLPITIELTPAPDLIVNNLTISGETIAESVINLSYTTLNQGAGAAAGPWRDQVFLSRSTDFVPDSRELLFSYIHSDTLHAGQSKTTSVELRIPSVVAGEWYIYVRTNVGEAVYEHGKTDNNVFRSGPWEIKERLTSDLEASNFVIAQAANAGQVLPISYTVTNKGAAPPNSLSWNELIYISDSPTLTADTIRLAKRIYAEDELKPGDSYVRTGSVQIPNGISGAKYIHMIVDGNKSVENELNRDNNLITASIAVTQPPTPDFQLVSVELPAIFYAGEPVWIQYTVRNQGQAATNSHWFDRMGASLSREAMPQGVSFKRQNRQIAPGSQYTDSMLVTMPLQFSGTYYFSVSIDHQNEIYEHNGEENNITWYPVLVLQPEPADLIVSQITSPANATPGRMTSYSFSVTNQGSNPVRSNFIANLYLDGNDFPGLQNSILWASERPSFSFLEPGNSISFSIDKAFPGLKDGLVNSRVLANASLSVKESDYTNNELIGDNPIQSMLTVLPVNTEIMDTLAMGSTLFYKLNLPDNADLRVRVTSKTGFGENGIFLRAGNVPTGPIFDIRNLSGNMASPVLLLPGTTAGENYLKIKNFNVSYIPTQDITIRADVLPFGIDSINPSVMGQGRVTSLVFGAGFRAGATVELLNQDNTTAATGQILRFLSSMELEVRWQLEEVPSGMYHLRITNPGGESEILSNAVRVEPAREFDVAMVPIYESIIGDRSPTTVGIVFRNISNVDIPYVNAAFHYLREHELLGMATPDNLFTQSKLLSSVTGLPQADFNDFTAVPEKNEGDLPENIIPVHIRDIAPGREVSFSLTFKNFPFSVFTLGVSYELLTTDQMMMFLTYNSMIIREYILSNPDFVEFMEFNHSQQGELYSSLANIDNYMLRVFETYASYGLVSTSDFINFMFNCQGCDIPENFNFFSNPELAAKSVILPGPTPPFPDPPSGCDNWGQAAANAYCNIIKSQVFQCSVAASCLVGIPLAAITIKLMVISGVGIPVLAASVVPLVAYFMACKSNALGCAFSFSDIPFPSVEEALCMEVVKPCDPNEIQGPTGVGDQQFIAQKDRVDYTVLFENEPETATAPAKQVRISVPISENANPLSARLSSFGFAGYTFEVPQNVASINQRLDLREKEGYFLDVIGGLDIQRNELFWVLTTIDPATGQIPVNPFAGFLQINDSTGVGEGFVKFSVTPHEGTVTGDTLAHFADIYFDLNPPITTNTHFNTIDAVAPVVRIIDLPEISPGPGIELTIYAEDDPGGSGVEAIELFVSRNGAVPELAGRGRQATWFVNGDPCDSLAFFIRSIDRVGNTSFMPFEPLARTVVGRDNVSAGPDVISCPGVPVTLTSSAGSTYLWSTGETTSSITVSPDTTTVYSVIVTFETGCPGVALVEVNVDICSQVAENMIPGNKMKVYPNPGTGSQIFADISGFNPGRYDLRVISQDGKIVQSETIEISNDIHQESLDIRLVPPGNYILELSGNGIKESLKIVISK